MSLRHGLFYVESPISWLSLCPPEFSSAGIKSKVTKKGHSNPLCHHPESRKRVGEIGELRNWSHGPVPIPESLNSWIDSSAQNLAHSGIFSAHFWHDFFIKYLMLWQTRKKSEMTCFGHSRKACPREGGERESRKINPFWTPAFAEWRPWRLLTRPSWFILISCQEERQPPKYPLLSNSWLTGQSTFV